jgi:hydrocephalus-inducing protein
MIVQVDFYLHDVDGVYSLQPSNENPHPENLVIHDMTRKATAASAIFELSQKIAVDLLFKPKVNAGPQRYEAVLRLVVVDNQYEDTLVHLIGESYTDDITLDNIHGLAMTNESNAIDSSQPLIFDEDTPSKSRTFDRIDARYRSYFFQCRSPIRFILVTFI